MDSISPIGATWKCTSLDLTWRSALPGTFIASGIGGLALNDFGFVDHTPCWVGTR